MNFKKNILSIASATLLLATTTASAQDSINVVVKTTEVKKVKGKTKTSVPSFGKGLNFTAADSTFAIKINGRFQTLAILEKTVDDGTEATGKIFTRRARLKFQGHAFTTKLKYKMELGLTNKDWGKAIPETGNAPSMILDAVLKWNFAKGFTVWLGQTKLPGNRERLISSQKLQFVDRSQLNSRYTLDRDRGVQLHHTFKIGKAVIREVASVATGEGRNITVDNSGGLAYTGKIEILPFGKFTQKGDYFGSDLAREKTPKLAIAAVYDYNDNTNRSRGQKGSFFADSVQTDLSSIMLDLMFKYKGFSVMSEFVEKQSSGSAVKTDAAGNILGEFYTGRGFNVQAGYLMKNNVEFAGRYTQITPNVVLGDNDYEQYTFGLSKYIKGHNLKVQTDVSLLVEDNVPQEELMYRFQVELAF